MPVAVPAPKTDATISVSDVTTNNVSTSKHGWTPKLPNDATKFLDGAGAYSVPPAASTSIFIGAAEMIPRTTNGCGINSTESSTNKVNSDTLDFDTSTQEFAQFIRSLPNNWNAGTVTVKFFWTAASGSGGVVWALAGYTFGDGVAIDTAMGTAQQIADTFLSANQAHVSSATPAITIGGTPATGTPIIFEVKRVPADSSDTLAVDASLLGVEITYTRI